MTILNSHVGICARCHGAMEEMNEVGGLEYRCIACGARVYPDAPPIAPIEPGVVPAQLQPFLSRWSQGGYHRPKVSGRKPPWGEHARERE